MASLHEEPLTLGPINLVVEQLRALPHAAAVVLNLLVPFELDSPFPHLLVVVQSQAVGCKPRLSFLTARWLRWIISLLAHFVQSGILLEHDCVFVGGNRSG